MDLEYLLFLQKIRLAAPDFVLQLFEYITNMGAFCLFPVVCLVYWCIKKEDGILASWSLGISMLAHSLLKQIMCIYRPWIRDARIVPPAVAKAGATGYSFPSGHSSNAAAYLGSIAWQNRSRRVLFWTLITLIVLICFSRNFLGVHTPQDVVVGCACGAISIFGAWLILKWEQKGKNRDIILFCASIITVTLFLLYITYKSYPLDYDSEGKLLVDPQKMALDGWTHGGLFIGLVLGWLLEKRTLNFQLPANWVIGLCRYGVGFGALLVLKHSNEFFGMYLPAPWTRFATGFVALFFIIYLYPVIFTLVENCFTKKEAVDNQDQI